ncbi:hypothetical protein [Erythrobacter sp. THAF29]|uniref:hypothetical protein n=1 Tax=Erythrobacter sp. THAF29 TaxID=2587851 RepID=UPI0012689A78|nr:hypothetical protein [Erythrobacter sp. THAF29]QFT76985.1 hypothetical protein FIU90_05480 [Erythrobacter sp. THAF29]
MSPQDNEVLAKQRYTIMNLVRIGSLGAVICGIAIARAVIDLPYALGVALAVGGLIGFFFGPRLLARRWKSGGDADE